MTLIPEKFIRSYAKNGQLNFTRHAIQRMNERKIKDSQVYECVSSGAFIEEQFHGRDIKIVFQQNSKDKIDYYVVVAACLPAPVVVTVCLTLEEVWDYLNGVLKRRKK